MSVHIRPALPEDLPAILDIYNQVVATTTAIYALQASTFEERRVWFDGRRSAGYPVLVADSQEGVLGYSSFGEFRGAWSGYRHSVEHSVHVRADARGRGIGAQLLGGLFEPAAALGKHVMIGAIDADNRVSRRLHVRLGFAEVAHFREVGYKFGRWLDLVFVQRFVDR